MDNQDNIEKVRIIKIYDGYLDIYDNGKVVFKNSNGPVTYQSYELFEKHYGSKYGQCLDDLRDLY